VCECATELLRGTRPSRRISLHRRFELDKTNQYASWEVSDEDAIRSLSIPLYFGSIKSIDHELVLLARYAQRQRIASVIGAIFAIH